MTETILIYLASILVLGIAAHWLAWRLDLPSILVLLIFGLAAGPATGYLDPDRILGDLLMPLVSLSVAVILFEGGLNLKIDELREIGVVVRNLITVGVLVTWLMGSLAAYLVLGLDRNIAILLGTILVVTGPTVILPMLIHVRPGGRVGPILRWEGIMNDPVGAVLAVLVFQAVVIGGSRELASLTLMRMLATVIVGTSIGALGEVFLVQFLKRYWIPDYLQNSVTLMTVVIVFTLSDLLQGESGLLAVTVMGIVLANQKAVTVRHIIEFKESLRVLLISALFIILAARLSVGDLAFIDGRSLIFLGIVMIVVRPAAVLASSYGKGLSWQELVFLSWMAPRGIVAAAVSSVFSIRLVEAGYPQAGALAPLTLFVIIGTVSIYGLTASRLACRLDLAEPNPQGVLIVGAHSWVRQVASALQEAGVRLLLVDTNYRQISEAYEAGLPTHQGNILAEHIFEEIDLAGMGRLMAMTSNDKANSLAALHFSGVFGRAEVYQLSPEIRGHRGREVVSPPHLRGRYLFGKDATCSHLSRLFEAGATVKSFRLTEEFGYEDFKERYGKIAIPLFLVGEAGRLTIFTDEDGLVPRPGQILIYLVSAQG